MKIKRNARRRWVRLAVGLALVTIWFEVLFG